MYLETIHSALYGEIQLHRDISSGEMMVVKKMNLESMETKVSVDGIPIAEDAFNEVKISQLLTKKPHPNIIHFKGCSFTKTECLIAMEHCSSGDLFTFNEKVHSYQLPQPLLQRMFTEIVNAVSHLHSVGVAHRDISLENVLLDKNLECRLCDFGLAAQNASVCHGKVGKPFYMAPEVLRGGVSPYDGYKADIWSLGVMLFILFTGIPPFEMAIVEDERFEIVQRYGVRKLLELYEIQVPEVAIDLMESLLVSSPNQRFSIEEVLAHPYFEQPTTLPRTNSWKKMSTILEHNVPCSSCPSMIQIGHRKRTCQTCSQVMCSPCHRQHRCRFH